MREPPAKPHFTQLSDSWVLWFEVSNQYIVIQEPLKALLNAYFLSKNAFDFDVRTKALLQNSLQDSTSYYAEIGELLKTANTPTFKSTPEDLKTPLIEKSDLKASYSFGNISITVNYGSQLIQDLIHPQWSHALEKKSSSTDFNIFQKDNALYLFKNKHYVGHYAVTDYHLLQGQFALQLINTLYNKNESDWIATFHASTICNDKEAIMIIGDSGNGKSTLSAVLMANGFDVLADDFSPLSAKNQELYRFPSGISVKKGAFSTLEPLFQDFDQFPVYISTSKNVKIKYIPPIANFNEAASHLPCEKIVFVKYEENATSQMKVISTEEILETLIPESWLSPLPSNSKLFLQWLQKLSCYELTYSNNDIAVSEFKKLFNS